MARSLSTVAIILSVSQMLLAQPSTLTRDRDPVVFEGAQLPSLQGVAVHLVVGFRYQAGWQQIPIQIDERKVVDYGTVYGFLVTGVTTLAYTDPNTYCGADPDATFDADDELVFMAKDAGARAGTGAGEPVGVVAGTGVEVAITDTLDSGSGWVYLFVTDGSLTPDAGQDYVSYEFNLLAGSYIPDYNTLDGPNPEDSVAWSAYYETHFSDRWIRDELKITAGASTGVDILDRHRNLFGPGICGRSEDSFSNGEGAFFVNKDGPVRALRSYMGANSGPLTQRVHRFYEHRQDITTHLRVHAIKGVMDFFDYSPAASGMTYCNDLFLAGATIDGVPDSVPQGQLSWEMVTGAQGSVLISHRFETDIPSLVPTSYYGDDVDPSVTQCTGDDFEYGASGPWINQSIPNTDPAFQPPPYYLFQVTRTMAYEEPNATTADAALHHQQVSTPLIATVADYEPKVGLTLTVVNEPWGTVSLDPEPDDPNAPAFAVGAVVTLTAEPNEGKAFKHWEIYDPNYPDDVNYAVTDANEAITLVMDTDLHVNAVWMCGSSAASLLPMAVAVLGALVLTRRSG